MKGRKRTNTEQKWMKGIIKKKKKKKKKIPVKAKFSAQSRMAVGPTQPPIYWVPGLFPWGKATGGWS
jgi:hypothetical protein